MPLRTVQVGSVMGMSVSLDLLAAIYPIAISTAALEHDLHQLEAARFMRPTDVPGTWFMTHVRACTPLKRQCSFFLRVVLYLPAACLPSNVLVCLPLCARGWNSRALLKKISECSSACPGAA